MTVKETIQTGTITIQVINDDNEIIWSYCDNTKNGTNLTKLNAMRKFAENFSK